MGGITSTSASAFGFIFIRTDKPVYYAGETVSGSIYVSLHQFYPGYNVCLKVKGNEQTHWTESEDESYTDSNGDRQTRSVTRHHNGNKDFFHHRVPLYTFIGGGAPPGQYTFPFSFALPDYLPGTFEMHGDPSASIKYEVKGVLEPNTSSVEEMRHRQDLVIREPIKENIHSMRGEMNVNMNTWCCIPQGTLMIRGYFAKNAYAPGETAEMICEIDNTKCKLDIFNIVFTLKQHVSLRSDWGQSKQSLYDILVRRFAGLKAGESAMGDLKRTLAVQLLRDNGGEIQPSTRGAIVESRYSLEIRAEVDGCMCCATVPNIEAPILLFASQPASYQTTLQAPPDWNPQFMPTINVVLNDGYIYKKNNIAPPPPGNYAPPPQNNFAPPPPPGLSVEGAMVTPTMQHPRH